MGTNYSFRKANINDAGFLADVIIGAEKSMTSNMGLARIFDLSEMDIKKYIIAMLEEEADGCEFSISSYFIVQYNDKLVAASGGWLECYYDNMPSSLVKSNLIGFTLPRESVLKAQNKFEIVKGLQFIREKGAYQLEYLYVDPDHRGKELSQQLLQMHFDYARQLDPGIKKAQAQPYESNKSSIRMLEKSGFRSVQWFTSQHDEVLNYLPFNVKILMEKSFQ